MKIDYMDLCLDTFRSEIKNFESYQFLNVVETLDYFTGRICREIKDGLGTIPKGPQHLRTGQRQRRSLGWLGSTQR